jgi:uncharacterized protein
MTGNLTLFAALLLGLAAGGHCLVMCGGIAAALGLATAPGRNGRPRALYVVGYQVGRVLAYALVALALGGAFGALAGAFATEAVQRTLRIVAALALVAAALVAFGRLRDVGAGFVGRRIWPKLAPLGRKLLPVTSLPRAVGFGMVWGFMPCGFVYTVLTLATLQLDAWRAAATMLMFGLGTAPAMLAAVFGARSLATFGSRTAMRRGAGVVLLAGATLTLTGPWLVAAVPALHPWMPYICSVDAR